MTEKENWNCPTPPSDIPDIRNLVGLALSGGGIRSASFNLGVLQGLAERKVLWIFDYLSTVSGGGFVGAWWSAWLSRAERPVGTIFPAEEEIEPERCEATARLLGVDGTSWAPPHVVKATQLEAGRPEAARIARRSDPINFLRVFSDYLTPRTGALSPDTWRLIAWYARSLLFGWAALLPIFCAAIMLAQAFYLSSPKVARAFLCPVSPAERNATDAVSKSSTDQRGPLQASRFCPPSTERMQHPKSRHLRFHLFLMPACLVLAAALTLSTLWLAHSSALVGLAMVGIGALAGLGWWVVSHIFPTSSSTDVPWEVVAVIVGGTVFLHLCQSFRNYERVPASSPGKLANR